MTFPRLIGLILGMALASAIIVAALLWLQPTVSVERAAAATSRVIAFGPIQHWGPDTRRTITSYLGSPDIEFRSDMRVRDDLGALVASEVALADAVEDFEVAAAEVNGVNVAYVEILEINPAWSTDEDFWPHCRSELARLLDEREVDVANEVALELPAVGGQTALFWFHDNLALVVWGPDADWVYFVARALIERNEVPDLS